MIIGTLLCLCFSVGAQFDVQGISLAGGGVWVMQAQRAPGPQCDFLALRGHTLQFYSGLTLEPYPALTLNEGTRCFDLADIDADGKNEVVAVQGDRIMAYALPEAGKAVSPPRELFAASSMLSDLDQSSRPYPLVIEKEGRPFIALPVENTIQLRALDGTVDMTFGMAPEDPEKPNEEGHFYIGAVHPSTRGTASALDCNVSRGVRGKLEYPDFLTPPPEETHGSQVLWTTTLYAYNTPPTDNIDRRPWFPLKTSLAEELRVAIRQRLFSAVQPLNTSLAEELRVAYQYKNPGWMSTKICIMSMAPEGEKATHTTVDVIGREREYPGQAIVTDTLPDFNGDGYTDLLLWKTTPPGTSVDAITRAIAGGSWKVVFSVHLYSPEEERYELLPLCAMECFVPLATFISMWNFVQMPFANTFLCDFNDDGRTDIGCSPSDTTYAIWICGEDGFSKEPDFYRSFQDPIQSAYLVDTAGNGQNQIVVKTEKNFYVLRVV